MDRLVKLPVVGGSAVRRDPAEMWAVNASLCDFGQLNAPLRASAAGYAQETGAMEASQLSREEHANKALSFGPLPPNVWTSPWSLLNVDS